MHGATIKTIDDEF